MPHTKADPHRPYADQNPDNPGVVVYFERDGTQFAVPCDQWNNLRDNAQAIAKYLDAKRAIQRYGVSTVGSEYQAQALPSGDKDTVVASEPPHEVLEVSPSADSAVVEAAYRAKMQGAYPDKGGSTAEFERVRQAKEAVLDD